jgi:Fe-S cluster assembly protein SufD
VIVSYIAVQDIATYHSARPAPKWLDRFRTRAAERFSQIDWPTPRDEEWRRTPLRTIDFDSYSIADDGAASQAQPDSRLQIAEAAGTVQVRNGSVLSAELSEGAKTAGVRFGSATSLLAEHPELASDVEDLLTSYLDTSDNRLQLWHASLLGDAVLLYVPANVDIPAPFVVEALSFGDAVATASAVIVVVADGARAQVIRRTGSGSDGEVVLLDGTIAGVGANASFAVTEIQDLNDEILLFSHGTARVARDARLDRTEVHAGGDLVKARFVVDITGPGADVNLNGAYCATEAQHIDLRTVQNHAAPHSTSRAFYKGAVREEAHSIYQGLIRVAPEAPGTDAYLTNNNLVLSDSARADSIPSLNIAIDDVRCSHGSTTGKLDENQLFYLRSRGWPEEEARKTLIEAFFEEVIALTPVQVHEVVRELVAARMIADAEDDE